MEESTVQTMLFLGELKPADLCWTEGMHEWKPIGEVVEYNAPGPPPAPKNARKRNAFRLIFFGFIWFFVFFYALMFVIELILGNIAVNGLITSEEEFDDLVFLLSHPALFIAAALSIWLTVVGKVPGTRR